MAGLFARLQDDDYKNALSRQFAHRVNCPRCKAKKAFEQSESCCNCGMSFFQVVRRVRRRNINGKRGRNSGTTNTSK